MIDPCDLRLCSFPRPARTIKAFIELNDYSCTCSLFCCEFVVMVYVRIMRAFFMETVSF